MSDSEKDKPAALLDYANPKPHRSFQEALTEFVRDETIAGRIKPTSRTRAVFETAGVLLTILGLVLAISWAAYLLKPHIR